MNWAILEISDLDYIAWGEIDLSSLPSIKTSTNEHNQNEYANELWYCLCTFYGALWAWEDNTSIIIDEPKRKELAIKRAKLDDFNPSVWGLLSKWVDIVRQHLKTVNDNIASTVVEVWSNTFYELLSKWYRLNIWMYIKEWYKEWAEDWVLEIDELWVKNRYGHSLSIKKNWDDYIIDNYKWIMKRNIFKIDDIKAFIDKWIIFKYCYLIYNPKVNMTNEIRNKIKLESARKAFDNNIWNWLDGDKVATREQVAAMIERALELIKK